MLVVESDLTQKISFSFVVPVYNEEKNIIPLHEELTTVTKILDRPYEILYIDDGSIDESYPVLQKLHTVDDHVRVLRFRRNFGQTAAFAAGFDHARGEIIITLDADGQNDTNDIPCMVEKLISAEYDFVVGWRVTRKESFIRKIVSMIANRIISQSTQVSIHDRGCSLKVFRSELLKNLHLYGQLHRFLPDLVSMVGARVAEMPVHDRSRRFGRSKYGALSRTPRVVLDLVTVFFLIGFFSSPMRFFGGAGLVSVSTGMVIGIWMSLAKIYAGIVGGWPAFNAYQIGNRPLLSLAILLIVIGVQFLMMGLLGEMIMRIYYEAQNKPIYYIRNILERG